MKIYSTMSQQKEEFVPAGEYVTMYVCGITPQSEAHVGHAMSYINFDIIKRYLMFKGYKVKHVQNVTDIEDKIINKANAMGIAPDELVRRNIEGFWQDLDSLNILRADVYPFATKEIPSIIDMIQGLIDKGYAYQTPNGVYYRVEKKDDYGKLAHRTLDQMMAGSRIEVDTDKENPMDFVLWKATKPGEPSWESPWGPGRPGWHIECSAMSLKYLGETIDIHGGGEDLIFPHHENEIAQSEAYTGIKPFVRFWLHNGLMQLGKDKMSKSIGNVISIKEALKKYSSDALRMFVLSSHYRSPLTYTDESMESAQKGAERLAQAVSLETKGDKPSNIDLESYRTRFTESMDDDFNSSQAVAALFDLAREINKARDNGCDVTDAVKELKELGGVLGLTFKMPEKNAGDAAPFIELLIETRKELRAAKQYQMADALRKRLEELGVTLEDGPTGTTWKLG
jgi:cysteinyl-tRNA synthetase